MDDFNINHITIHTASIHDLAEILMLNLREYWTDVTIWEQQNSFQRWQKGSWWVDKSTLRWHWDILQQCKGGILIALYDNRIIGELDYVISIDYILERKIKRFHVIWLLIDQNYRQMGIARKLIEGLKLKSDNDAIWVESEDYRSENLYRSIGKPIYYISNWKIMKINNNQLKNIKKQISQIRIKSLYDLLKYNWRIVIGKYFAPSFDLTQLGWSEPVSPFIWGNSPPLEILEYKLENTHAIVLVTQYLRILVKNNYNDNELQDIIVHATHQAILIGFDAVFIQIYSSISLNQILMNIGYNKISNNDPVFQL